MGWKINTTPRPLYLQDRHSLPLYRRLGGTQSPSGGVSRRENTLLSQEFKPQPRHYAEYFFPAPAIRYEHSIFVNYLLKFWGEGWLLNRFQTLPPKDRGRGKLRYVILCNYTFVCTGAIIDWGLGSEIVFRVYKNVV